MPPARFGGFGRWLLMLALAPWLVVCVGTRAWAQPPLLGSIAASRPLSVARAPAQPGGIPPSVRSVLERVGGARALRVAEGLPAGKHVALRPMFWLTRDRTGAMFALGGRF